MPVRRILASIAFGLTVFLIVLEVYLRWLSPMPLRLRGNKISLARNVTWFVPNNRIAGTDTEIIHHRNSLGFRGQEPPIDGRNAFTVLTVGGSTTECFYLSEGKTWPDRLYQDLKPDFPNLWLNNAGLDGHSTFGHIILLKDYLIPLRPDMILFLVGINDIERDDLNRFDSGTVSSKTGLPDRVLSYSYALSFLRNLGRSAHAWRVRLVHGQLQLAEAGTEPDPSNAEERALLDKQRTHYLPGYKSRVEILVRLCRDHGIQPVLITQPSLYGTGIDPATGVNLERIRYEPGRNGRLAWKILEMYNDVTRAVSRENNVHVIDLARRMPKSSRYYYDFHHLNVDGAEEVARLIAPALKPWLEKK